MKIGFIGCGKMAAALIKGVIKSGLCKPADITASDVAARDLFGYSVALSGDTALVGARR